MTYNLTPLLNSTDIGGLVVSANQLAGGLLISGFSIAVFFVVLMRNRGQMVESLAVSGFVSFILAAILGFLGVLNFAFLIGYLIITALSVLYLYMRP